MPQGSESFRPIAPFASIAATFGISPWIKRRQPEMSSSAFFASGVVLAGTFGDFLGGVASDRVFESTHRHADDQQGVRDRGGSARLHPQFVLLDLCVHADPGRLAWRPHLAG